MDSAAIERAAELLWQARLAGRRMEDLPADCRPRSLDAAYAVQDAIAVRAKRKTAGWKLAVTSAAGQKRLAIDHPLSGRLFEGFVVADGARLDAGPMRMRVAEPEFAFRLGRDLLPRNHAYALEEVVDAVAALHLAIEVPDSRFERFAEMDAAAMVADGGFAGWFVLGPTVANWRDLDLATRPVRALRNGAPAGAGRAADTLGDPRRQLHWLAQDRARRGDGLKAGDLVTTGTCCPPVAVAPGDRVRTEFEGLGAVEVAFG